MYTSFYEDTSTIASERKREKKVRAGPLGKPPIIASQPRLLVERHPQEKFYFSHTRHLNYLIVCQNCTFKGQNKTQAAAPASRVRKIRVIFKSIMQVVNQSKYYNLLCSRRPIKDTREMTSNCQIDFFLGM